MLLVQRLNLDEDSNWLIIRTMEMYFDKIIRGDETTSSAHVYSRDALLAANAVAGVSTRIHAQTPMWVALCTLRRQIACLQRCAVSSD